MIRGQIPFKAHLNHAYLKQKKAGPELEKVEPEPRRPALPGTMARYDEDLHENPFFQTLTGKYGSLFNEAAEQRWLVSV